MSPATPVASFPFVATKKILPGRTTKERFEFEAAPSTVTTMAPPPTFAPGCTTMRVSDQTL
jgi:hypothetical protein